MLPSLFEIRTARIARRQLKLSTLERVFMATTARIRAVLPDSQRRAPNSALDASDRLAPPQTLLRQSLFCSGAFRSGQKAV